MSDDLLERAATVAGWALCKDAGGAGEGKCDPNNCCCHGEARIAVTAVYSLFAAERDALRAKLDVACKALKPFAAAEVYCGSQNTDPDDEVVKWLFAVGHIRRARAVYEKIKGGGDE